MRTKIIRKKNMQRIVHLRASPTRFSPTQLMMMQPKMMPIMPWREVDAPALIVVQLLSTARLKMLPAIPLTKKVINVLRGPKVCQILVTSTKVANMFPMRCTRLIWTKMALSSLYTSPLETPGPQFAPNFSSELLLIYSRFPDLLIPQQAQPMNIASSAITISMVSERHRQVGQKDSISISQKFSSLGFLSCCVPETSRTFSLSAKLICY